MNTTISISIINEDNKYKVVVEPFNLDVIEYLWLMLTSESRTNILNDLKRILAQLEENFPEDARDLAILIDSLPTDIEDGFLVLDSSYQDIAYFHNSIFCY